MAMSKGLFIFICLEILDGCCWFYAEIIFVFYTVLLGLTLISGLMIHHLKVQKRKRKWMQYLILQMNTSMIIPLVVTPVNTMATLLLVLVRILLDGKNASILVTCLSNISLCWHYFILLEKKTLN